MRDISEVLFARKIEGLNDYDKKKLVSFYSGMALNTIIHCCTWNNLNVEDFYLLMWASTDFNKFSRKYCGIDDVKMPYDYACTLLNRNFNAAELFLKVIDYKETGKF